LQQSGRAHHDHRVAVAIRELSELEGGAWALRKAASRELARSRERRRLLQKLLHLKRRFSLGDHASGFLPDVLVAVDSAHRHDEPVARPSDLGLAVEGEPDLPLQDVETLLVAGVKMLRNLAAGVHPDLDAKDVAVAREAIALAANRILDEIRHRDRQEAAGRA
jgi:hypothetical protein